MPIVAGDSAIGVISVQSTREVGRFSESDSGLLATIAANVGVAIQNARLFEAQRTAERQYRALVEELPLVVYTHKPDASGATAGIPVYISPRVEQVFGYPLDAWLEEGFTESVLLPEDRESTLARTHAHLEAGDERWSSSTAFARPTGESSGSATTPGSFATSRAPRPTSRVS